MDANTMPRSSAVSFPYDAKSYRTRNLRNLAMGVAGHSVPPRPSVPAPVPGSPCPLARRSRNGAGSHGVGALVRTPARRGRDACLTTFLPQKCQPRRSHPDRAAWVVRTSRSGGATPRGRPMAIEWPYLCGIWLSVSRFTTRAGSASIVNVNVYNPRRKAPRIAERMRRDGSPYFG
jgi:hypothetical protein